MKRADDHIIIRATEEDFQEAVSFVEDLLERSRVNSKVRLETLIVFDTLFQDLLMQGYTADTEITVSGRNRLGEVNIKMGFEGEPFTMRRVDSDDEDDFESMILQAFADKIDCNYHSGYNIINISARRNYRNSLLCILATFLAVAVYLPISQMLDEQAQKSLLTGYIFPLEEMFANAVLMVGAPVTFFSLLKNLSNAYIVAERGSGIRPLQVKTILTSLNAIALALVSGFLLVMIFHDFFQTSGQFQASNTQWSFAEIIESAVPKSILDPFVSISPFPLILVVLLSVYALCSMGSYFDLARNAIGACYALFSRMLQAIMIVLPIFCFLAFLDVLLRGGLQGALYPLALIGASLASLVLLAISYAIRLRTRGVAVIPFVKKLGPLVRENIQIGSTIDAVPFNIRYLAKHYGMDRNMLKKYLPVVAQLNLDGNCYLIMLATLLFMFASGSTVWLPSIIALAVLVLLLSLGAPNQPGSILIGLLIVLTYLGAYDMLPLAIYLEGLLGTVLNAINVVGDVVLMQVEDVLQRRQANADGAAAQGTPDDATA